MSDKIYWVRTTVLYRIPAKDLKAAKTEFFDSRTRDEHHYETQEEEWFVSTSRWTQKQSIDEEPPG